MADFAAGRDTLKAMAAIAEEIREVPLQVICAGLAHWVAGVQERLTEQEREQILELGAALWRKANAN
ncbi:MAG TPA: hypothetical protein VK614_02360 [Allosphingosinicella sp.]|nr:hypothetical protein [Allosphingosinicella sp.]